MGGDRRTSMSIRDIMSTDVVSVRPDEDLQTAVSRMLDNNVGSVVVESEGDPVGIITESDVLEMGRTFEVPFAEIPVTRSMSKNPVTVTPDCAPDEAVGTMRDYGIKKLPVLEGDALVGIVTLTDLVYYQHDLATEAKRLERERAEQEPSEVG